MSTDLQTSIDRTKREIRLKWYEEEITKRGKSLAAIFIELRDDPMKPWKVAADTFEEYCGQRWGMSLRRMQQLAAGETVKALLTTEAPDMAETVAAMPEGQLRVLATTPAPERVKVLRTAVATSPKLTAKTIKAAKAKVIDATPPVAEQPPETCPHCGQAMPTKGKP